MLEKLPVELKVLSTVKTTKNARSQKVTNVPKALKHKNLYVPCLIASSTYAISWHFPLKVCGARRGRRSPPAPSENDNKPKPITLNGRPSNFPNLRTLINHPLRRSDKFVHYSISPVQIMVNKFGWMMETTLNTVAKRTLITRLCLHRSTRRASGCDGPKQSHRPKIRHGPNKTWPGHSPPPLRKLQRVERDCLGHANNK